MQHEVEILDRLSSIEMKIDSFIRQPTTPDYYSVAEFAELVKKRCFTVREYCRLGRINAEKRHCGRGTSLEWKIAHKELLRYLSDGLLPDQRRD